MYLTFKNQNDLNGILKLVHQQEKLIKQQYYRQWQPNAKATIKKRVKKLNDLARKELEIFMK